MIVSTLDISHSVQSANLYARQIWAMLYPIFIESFDGVIPQVHELDFFLCDLATLQSVLADHLQRYAGHEYSNIEPLVIYWELGNRGYTKIATYWLSDVYKVTFIINDKIVVEKV